MTTTLAPIPSPITPIPSDLFYSDEPADAFSYLAAEIRSNTNGGDQNVRRLIGVATLAGIREALLLASRLGRTHLYSAILSATVDPRSLLEVCRDRASAVLCFRVEPRWKVEATTDLKLRTTKIWLNRRRFIDAVVSLKKIVVQICKTGTDHAQLCRVACYVIDALKESGWSVPAVELAAELTWTGDSLPNRTLVTNGVRTWLAQQLVQVENGLTAKQFVNRIREYYPDLESEITETPLPSTPMVTIVRKAPDAPKAPREPVTPQSDKPRRSRRRSIRHAAPPRRWAAEKGAKRRASRRLEKEF